MNDLENYKAILDQYFGIESARFDTSTGETNNLIGALNRTGYESFRSVFLNRCKRLAARYMPSYPNRKHLLDRLNEICNKDTWNGAYAEMVVYDFLNSDGNWLPEPINLSKTVPATETLAGSHGKKHANFDGYYDEFNVCFDVKVLGDKSRQILDEIISKAKAKIGNPSVSIIPEYPLDNDFALFRKNDRSLIEELAGAINVVAKTTLVKSLVLPQLSYKLIWQSGSLTTVSTYDPYQHAENHHHLLFKHAKKFSVTQPSLIVFVFFPWFSEKVIGQFDSNQIFYRSLCRRFFCQYAKDLSPAKNSPLCKGFQGSETLAEVPEKLSGILFLEDTSITTSDTESQNVEAFAYLNPNAAHKVSDRFRDHLSSLGFLIDDLAHDNY